MQLVVGATGHLGGAVVQRLLTDGRAVRALVRESSDLAPLQQAGAEIVIGDLRDRASLGPACRGIEGIVATATAAARGGEDTVEAVDRLGYAHLIQAAEAAGVGQFVFVSAHGFAADSPVALARAKAATEAALEASELQYTILRPVLFMEAWIGMILGGQLEAGSEVHIIGSPDTPYPFVSAADVVGLILAVLGHRPGARTRVPLSAGRASYGQLVEWLGEATGRELKLRSAPPGTALPGLPPIVVELWSWAARGGMGAIETPEVARRYGLQLEPPKAYIERCFGAASGAG